MSTTPLFKLHKKAKIKFLFHPNPRIHLKNATLHKKSKLCKKIHHIPSEQLRHLPNIELIVLRCLPVPPVVPIPRREVNPNPNPRRRRSRRQLGHDVALPALPRGGPHRVVGVGGGPEAEAVVVLGSEDEAGESVVGGGAGPLGGGEGRGVEDGGVGEAGAPLSVGEGVGAEVEEEGHLRLLPPELGGGGEGQNGKWGRGVLGMDFWGEEED